MPDIVKTTKFFSISVHPYIILASSFLRATGVIYQDTNSLHCSSFWGLPFRILNIEFVKPKKGTTMETIDLTVLVPTW